MGRLVLKHTNLKQSCSKFPAKTVLSTFVLGWGGRVTASGVSPAEAGLFPASTSQESAE
jgi:hypothetical protein